MAKARSSKRQLEKARKDKAVAKRERKDERSAAPKDTPEGDGTPQGEVLARLAAVHEQYANGDMSLDDFDAAKEELVALLLVE